MGNFPCSGCGSCCKRIDKAVANVGADKEDFPYEWDASGRCEKLDQNNQCMVYENRPLLCDVDRLMGLLDIPTEVFYELNIQACNTMMDEDNVDKSFRIKTKKNG